MMNSHMPKSSAEQLQKKPVSSKPETLIHVLHVDNDAEFLKNSKRFLETHNPFQIEIVLSVKEALRKLRQKSYDAIVSAYRMSERDGLDFLKELRDRGDDVPFILFTGKGREEVAIKALNLGADRYFNKSGKPKTVYGELSHGIITAVKAKRAEKALQESEEKYRKQFEEAMDAIFLADAETGITVDCNRAATKLVGRKKSELVGKHQRILHPPEAIEGGFSRTFMQHRKEKKPQILEDQIITKNGEIRDVIINATTFELEGKKLIQATFHDITEHKKTDEKLKESERKYRLLTENITDVVYIQDMNLNVTYASPSVEKLSGYTPEELLKLRPENFMTRESFERGAADFKETITSAAENPHYEIPLKQYEYVRKDGSTFWGELKMKLLRDSNNNLVGVQGTLRDITERKKTEEKLRESEEKFRNLAEKSPNMIFINKKGRVVYANKRCEEVMGYKREEFYSPNFDFFTLIAPESMKKLKSNYSKHRKGEEVHPYEYSLITKEGQRLEAILTSKLMTYEGDPAILGIITDITERKKTEEKLRESEEKFHAIIDSAKNSMILIGETGEIIYWNAAAERTFGYTNEEAIGKELHRFLAPERFYEEYRRGLTNFKETGQGAIVGKTLELTAIKKDGTEIQIELSLSAFKLKGKWCAIGIVRDITERKEAEEKLDSIMDELVTINEKLGVVGRLTRHDARNKLSVIANNVYLAKQKIPANNNSLRYLGDVESAIDQMEKIFEFARNYEMLGVEELSYMDVGRSVEEAAILLSGLAEIKLVNECQGLMVMADSLLRQLFYNLIDDTLKYGEKVSQIRVYHEEGEDQLKLVYEDDGVGIPENEKKLIFKEGYGKSTGYGLYLIQKICEAYGWTIRETGKQGKGAQFTIIIPKTNKNGKKSYRIG
jgi:PAS domain S-box-containing protein